MGGHSEPRSCADLRLDHCPKPAFASRRGVDVEVLVGETAAFARRDPLSSPVRPRWDRSGCRRVRGGRGAGGPTTVGRRVRRRAGGVRTAARGGSAVAGSDRRSPAMLRCRGRGSTRLRRPPARCVRTSTAAPGTGHRRPRRRRCPPCPPPRTRAAPVTAARAPRCRPRGSGTRPSRLCGSRAT